MPHRWPACPGRVVVAGDHRARPHAGGDLLTWLGHEPAIRAMEQGRPLSLADLAPDTLNALA
jgi:hypothetical protein